MEATDHMQDRIDEYITGAMSEQDKALFEEELSRDAALRQEVEVQRMIAEAVQVVQLRKVLDEAELSVKKSPRRSLKATLFWATSIAASFVVFAFVYHSIMSVRLSSSPGLPASAPSLPEPESPQSGERTKQITEEEMDDMLESVPPPSSGRPRPKGATSPPPQPKSMPELPPDPARIPPQYYEDRAAVEPRTTVNDLYEVLSQVYSQMNAGEYDLAEKTLAEAKALLKEELEEETGDLASLKRLGYEFEWCEARLAMKRGDNEKAIRILRKIVSSGGPYAAQARDSLDRRQGSEPPMPIL